MIEWTENWVFNNVDHNNAFYHVENVNIKRSINEKLILGGKKKQNIKNNEFKNKMFNFFNIDVHYN